jgi:hypothetical protein
MTRFALIRVLLIAFLALVSGDTVFAQYYVVSGTVTNPALQPIPGVDILMYTEQGDPIGQYIAVTDSSGFYSISNVLSGTYGISFRPADDANAPEYLMFTVGQANVTLNVTLQYGNVLSGYVRDSQGNALESIDLNVYDQATDVQLYTPSDNSNAEGFYDITIPSGVYRIAYRTTDGEPYVPVELLNVPVNADTSIDVVLLDGFFISGTVTGPGGTPVVDADLDAEDSQTGIKIYTPGDNTDINGDYQILVPAGIYDINVAPFPGDHLLPGIVYSQPVSSDIILDFSLESGYVLSGTVRNSEGVGIFNVDLDVEDANTGMPVFTPDDNTDSTGFYQVVLPMGIFNVAYKPLVVPPYLAAYYMQNLVITGDTNVDITLSDGLLLSGHVENSYGAGVFDIDFDATDSVTGISVPLSGDHSDSSGNFQTVLEPGTYNLEFEPPSQRRLEALLMPGIHLNIDTSVTAVLDTAFIVSGTVVDSMLNPLPNISVNAFESSSHDQIFTPGNNTDSLGLYSIYIHPDTYDLIYKPEQNPLDSMILFDVPVNSDTIINLVYAEFNPDTVAPSVTVLSPNGGESWAANSIQTITWNASDNIEITSLSIYLSVNGTGGPFSLISSGEANDGYYFWQVPYSPTDNAYVKIIAYDPAFNHTEDISDAPFSIFMDQTDCYYVPGDANDDGNVIGSDVTYMVNYFRGLGSVPPVSCWNGNSESWLYAAADANGDCRVIGSDITFLVTYFRGIQPQILYCPYTPPSGP